jgi:hypothetical protein
MLCVKAKVAERRRAAKRQGAIFRPVAFFARKKKGRAAPVQRRAPIDKMIENRSRSYWAGGKLRATAGQGMETKKIDIIFVMSYFK